MSDLKTLLREHYEPIAPAIDVERLFEELAEQAPGRVRWRRSMLAFGAAILVLIVIGSVVLLSPGGGELDLVDEPVPSTSTPTRTTPSSLTMASTAPATTQEALRPVRHERVLYESTSGSLDLGAIDVAPDKSLVVVVAEGTTTEGPPFPGILRIGRCRDLECSDPPEFETIGDYSDTAGLSVRSGPSGDPVIAMSGYGYRDPGGGASSLTLQLVTPEGIHELDRGIMGGFDLELQPDGLPVLAYYRWQGSGEVLLLRCGNQTCDENNVRTLVETADGFRSLDLEVSPDGGVRLIYQAGNRAEVWPVKVARCTDATCPEGPTITELPLTELVGFASGPDGSPRLLLGRNESPETSGFDLIACDDLECSGWTETNIDHGRPVPEVGEDEYFDQIVDWADPFVRQAEWNRSIGGQIMIDSSGNPVVAWLTGAERGWIATCEDPQCSGYTVIDLGYLEGANHLAAVLGSKDQPVILYSNGHQVGLIDCVTRSCLSE